MAPDAPLREDVLGYISLEYIEDAIGINPVDVLVRAGIIIIILVATVFAARIVDGILKSRFPRIIGAGMVQMSVDETFNLIIRRLAVAAVYIVGLAMIILQVPPLQRLGVTVLAGAGVAGIAIGFAAQDSLSNIISGIFLAVFKPVRIGDLIDFKGDYGLVEDLTLRHTVIRTWDRRRIIVPNSAMNKENIVNWSYGDGEVIWKVEFGVSYEAEIDLARRIILDEAMKHPTVMKDRKISVQLTEMSPLGMNLRLSFSVPGRNLAFDTGCDIREGVKKRFDLEGIGIPYQYQNVTGGRGKGESGVASGGGAGSKDVKGPADGTMGRV